MARNRISAVIVTRDRPAELVATLGGLVAQQRPPDEVIVVDIGSRKVRVHKEGFEEFTLSIHLPAVADDTSQTGSTFGKFSKSFTDVICSIDSHQFSTGNYVNLFGFSFADRHCKSAAHDVTKYVVKYIVKIIGICSQVFEQPD